MFNYLALLGWSPRDDREILSRQELIDEFRLENVRSSPAFFDQQKLASVNATYLRSLSPDEFAARASEWLSGRWSPIAPLVQERARTLADVYSMVDFLYLPEVKVDLAAWDKGRRQQPAFVALLEAAQARYDDCEWDVPGLRGATVDAGAAVGVTALGKAQAPIRLAVTGRSIGPPLFESLVLLGRQRTLARLASARDRAVAEDHATGGR
jgi:glutamyl-tRNA synthetase